MKEDILFSLLKDKTETIFEKKRHELKKKFPDVDITNLHRRIVNYQIKKYGGNLVNYVSQDDNYLQKINTERKRKMYRLYDKEK